MCGWNAIQVSSGQKRLQLQHLPSAHRSMANLSSQVFRQNFDSKAGLDDVLSQEGSRAADGLAEVTSSIHGEHHVFNLLNRRTGRQGL